MKLSDKIVKLTSMLAGLVVVIALFPVKPPVKCVVVTGAFKNCKSTATHYSGMATIRRSNRSPLGERKKHALRSNHPRA
jgi:hypothetical protein